MVFPRYESYRDSGVDWLGEIPAGWKIQRLGTVFDERKEKVSDKDFPPLSVTKNGVLPQLETAAKSDDGDNRKGVREGDFVINSRSDRKGSSGIAKQDGSVSLINIVLKPKGINTGYCEHLLKSNGFIEEFYRNGHGIVADLWTTRYWDMKSILIPLPDLPAQDRIANFLDQKTAEIDEAIAKKQRLIELLKEQKAILINRAVTKGLNPDVPMRDSGVEWIGEVPEHWQVKRVKHVFEIIDCKHLTASFSSEGYPLASIREVQRKRVSLATANLTTEKFYKQLISGGRKPLPGDIIYSRNVSVGCASLVDCDDTFAMGQDVCLLRPKDVDGSYFVHLLMAPVVQDQIKQLLVGSTFNRLNISQIKELIVCLPPKSEQETIDLKVNETELAFDGLIGNIETELSLLVEFFATLTAQSVTGKIKI